MGKAIVYAGAFVGSVIGGYVPVLFGFSALSLTSIFASFVGMGFGIYVGYKAYQYLDI